MSDHPVKSVVVSVASQPGSSSDGTDRQRSDIRTLIKKSWSTVTTSIKIALLAVLYSPAKILVALKDSLADIWVPLGRHVWGAIIGQIEVNLSMQQRRELLVTLVPHMVLCLTMTFLLPISFLRKLILIMGNFPPITRERILHIISCIALLVDPLFFYIPFIDEKRKCIGMDKELRAVVLALRSLTDLAFALHIDALIDVNDVISYEEITSRGLKWLSQDIIINVLPILPIQQVIILTIFFRMNGSGFLSETAIGGVFLALQFIARGCQIYHFWKPLVGKWATSAFYFLIYILTGHTYILWETQQALENEKEKIKSKYEALGTWMVRNGIPEEVKTEAVKIITEKKVVEKNYDADLDLVFVFNALTGDDNRDIRRDLKMHLCLKAQLKVFILDDFLPVVIDSLEPVIYKENSHVVKAGESIDRMLIITEGVIVCTDNTRANVAPEAGTSSTMKIPKSRFEKGEVYGEKLLTIDENDSIPTSAQDVKCESKVEAFALSRRAFNSKDLPDLLRRPKSLTSAVQSDGSNDLKLVNKAYRELTTTRSEKLKQKQMKILEWLSRNVRGDDLKTLVMEHMKASNVLEKNLDAEVDVKYLFSVGLSWDIEYRIKKQICINSLYQVPVLYDVDEDLLSRICMSLEPLVLPEHSCIFYPFNSIDRMLIVVEGEITVTKATYNYGSIVTKRGDVEKIIKKFDVIGEELLTLAFPIVSESSNSNFVDCTTKVEAFALTKEGLESVVAHFRDGINKFEQLEKGRDGVADTEGASRSTTTIDQRLDRLIQLLSDMVQQHRYEMTNLGRRLDEMAAFLSRLGYPAGTSPPAV